MFEPLVMMAEPAGGKQHNALYYPQRTFEDYSEQNTVDQRSPHMHNNDSSRRCIINWANIRSSFAPSHQAVILDFPAPVIETFLLKHNVCQLIYRRPFYICHRNERKSTCSSRNDESRPGHEGLPSSRPSGLFANLLLFFLCLGCQ